MCQAVGAFEPSICVHTSVAACSTTCPPPGPLLPWLHDTSAPPATGPGPASTAIAWNWMFRSTVAALATVCVHVPVSVRFPPAASAFAGGTVSVARKYVPVFALAWVQVKDAGVAPESVALRVARFPQTPAWTTFVGIVAHRYLC